LLFRCGQPPEVRYTFKHALLQDAAYEFLLRSSRLQLHARTAEALETQFPESVATKSEVLARHYTEARLTASALPYWLRAGVAAYSRSANQEAISHLGQGLTLPQELPTDNERAQAEVSFQAYLGLAFAAAKGYASSEAESAFTKAHALCQKMGNGPQLFPIIYGLFMFHWVRGNLDVA
jgi:predicted ATPase